MVFSIVSDVAERLSGFGPIHSASEFVRKVADQIIGDSQFQNSLPGQRDVEAMLRLLDHVGFEALEITRAGPQEKPGGRKALAVAPYSVQTWRVGEVTDVARPASIVVGEKQHSFVIVDKGPSCEMNRRHRVEFTQ